MGRKSAWADTLWQRVIVMFPDVNCGQAIAMLNGLGKKFDHGTVELALARLEGRVYEPGKMWPFMQKACSDVVKEAAQNFGRANRGTMPVERFSA